MSKREILRFSTTYQRHFTPKPVESYKQYYPDGVFNTDRILAEAFREYLLLQKLDPDKIQHANEQIVDEYIDQFLRAQKHHRDRFKKLSLDKDVLRHYFKELAKTTYRHDYKVDGWDLDTANNAKCTKNLSKKHFSLDSVIPETTYTNFYRNPVVFTNAALVTKSIGPRDNLIKNDKLERIKKVRTGETQYTAVHGTLGQLIVEEHVFGPIDKYQF